MILMIMGLVAIAFMVVVGKYGDRITYSTGFGVLAGVLITIGFIAIYSYDSDVADAKEITKKLLAGVESGEVNSGLVRDKKDYLDEYRFIRLEQKDHLLPVYKGLSDLEKMTKGKGISATQEDV